MAGVAVEEDDEAANDNRVLLSSYQRALAGKTKKGLAMRC